MTDCQCFRQKGRDRNSMCDICFPGKKPPSFHLCLISPATSHGHPQMQVRPGEQAWAPQFLYLTGSGYWKADRVHEQCLGQKHF